MYVNVCRGLYIIPGYIYREASLTKSPKSFVLDFRLGSKYTSGKSFAVEKGKVKVKVKSNCQIGKDVIELIVFWINKNHVCLTKREKFIFRFLLLLQTFKIKHNKPTANNGLMLSYKLWTILALCYNALTVNSVFHKIIFKFFDDITISTNIDDK